MVSTFEMYGNPRRILIITCHTHLTLPKGKPALYRHCFVAWPSPRLYRVAPGKLSTILFCVTSHECTVDTRK